MGGSGRRHQYQPGAPTMTDHESNGQPSPPPPAAPREPSFAPLFALGQLLATPSALRTLEAFGVDPLSLVVRHVRGDWGDLCTSDSQLNEAALIDGASRIGALWRIVLPLVTPGLAAAAILSLIYCWNEFLYAVILTGRDAKTVPVAISGFITNKDILWGRIAASGTVVLLPVLLFALSVQRYLVRGLARGAVK